MFLCLSQLLLAQEQERDTTKQKEELLLGSEVFMKTDEERRMMVLRPRFHYINTDDKPYLLKVGFAPNLGKYPSTFGFNKLGWSLGIGFEQRIKNSSWSWSIETQTRLYEAIPAGYDYRDSGESTGAGVFRGDWLGSGTYYSHKFRMHASLRYYYNMAARIDAEAGGNNLFSEYFFLRLRDVAAYAGFVDIEFNNQQQLLYHSEGDEWLFQPSYFSIGWGMQRPLFGKGLIDFNVGVGKRAHGLFSPDFYNRDFLFDFNLIIGLGL